MPVVDASVWVSLCHAGDRHHARSRAWLERAMADAEEVFAPTLFPVEVGAAIRRLTGSEDLARAVLDQLTGIEGPRLEPLTGKRSRRAAEIAARTGVRGADAIYLELAASLDLALVTWDRQQLERGAAVASVSRPPKLRA